MPQTKNETVVAALDLAVVALAPATLQTLEEAPGQTVVRSRHSLKDDRQKVWQAIGFARPGALNLRLVAFPGQYTLIHPAPLVLESVTGPPVLAPDNLPKGDAVANVGQFDVGEAIAHLPPNQRWVLTVPVVGGEVHIPVPREVAMEWAEVSRLPLRQRNERA